MDESITYIEQPLDTTPNETDKGLEDQSFFSAPKQPDTKDATIPTNFIMQRMLRVQ